MEITVEKVAMIRESYNPKNVHLNLDVDWSVEYKNTDQRDINYNIILKSSKYLNLKLEGLIKLGDLEDFVQEDCSRIVFHHACTILMNMFSLTRQSNYELFSQKSTSAVNLDTAF